MPSDEITKPDNLVPFVNGDRWATEEHRTKLMDWALARLGAPYGWNRKGPEQWDCSGFCTDGMRSVGLPDWRHTRTAADLYRELEPVSPGEALPMDLAFWTGKKPGSPVEHVMFLAEHGKVLGACGGDHTTITIEDALRDDAWVRFRSSIHYRDAFVGFRRLPIPEFNPNLT